MAGNMPSHIAVKIQGRSLASIGESVTKRNPERYMYQFLARERIRSHWEQPTSTSQLEEQEHPLDEVIPDIKI